MIYLPVSRRLPEFRPSPVDERHDNHRPKRPLTLLDDYSRRTGTKPERGAGAPSETIPPDTRAGAIVAALGGSADG
jgi:hypothetical protein